MSLILPPSYKTGFARNGGECAHPELWQGLVGAWVPMLGNSGSSLLRDVSGYGKHATTFSNAAWDTTRKGWGVNFDRSSGGYVTTTNSTWQSGPYSFACGVRMDSVPAASNEMTIFSNFSALGTFDLGGTWTGLSTFVQNGTEFTHFFGRYSGDTTLTLWINGVSQGNKTTASQLYHRTVFRIEGTNAVEWVTGGAASKGPLNFGRPVYTASDFFDGPLGYFYAWDRPYGGDVARKIYRNNLAPFQKRRRVQVLVPAAGPTYTLTAESGSVAITGSAVSLLKNSVLSAGSGAVTITGSDVTLAYFTVHPTERVIKRATHRTGRYNFSPMGYYRLGESYRESSRAYRIQESSVVAEFIDAEGGGGGDPESGLIKGKLLRGGLLLHGGALVG